MSAGPVRLRVLHIGKFYPPDAGGMEYFIADLLPALNGQGVDAAALVHAGLAPAGVTRRRIPVYRAPCYGRLLYAPLSPLFPFWLRRARRDVAPHLLHLHLPNTSAFWVLLSPAARRLPWVVHWHSDVVAGGAGSGVAARALALAYRLYRPLEQRLLARAAAVVVTSAAYLAGSEALRPWRGKCRVVPLGVDPERVAGGSETPSGAMLRPAPGIGAPDAPLRLLAVGRLAHYKGFEVLLRALAMTRCDATLTLVGDGERRAALAALVDRLRLGGRVELAGRLPDAALRALWRECDLLCLPSVARSEAFGLVLLEAMCFGKPVVASDLPGSGVGWVVRQGGHGLAVAPGDAPALAAAIDRLAASPARRAAFGRRGARALRQRFGINRVAARLAALYRECLVARADTAAVRRTAAPARAAETAGSDW